MGWMWGVLDTLPFNTLQGLCSLCSCVGAGVHEAQEDLFICPQKGGCTKRRYVCLQNASEPFVELVFQSFVEQIVSTWWPCRVLLPADADTTQPMARLGLPVLWDFQYCVSIMQEG
jgi:hypothetical protein